MKSKFIKYSFSFGILIIFMTIFLCSNMKIIKASTANIRYITTSVGENETSIGINYQVDVEGSYVKYGKSRTLGSESLTKYPTKEESFESGIINNDKNTGFAARYVCKVDLTDLDEDTTYYYKVCADGAESSIYSFKTYKKNGTYTNILFTTDLHASAGYNTTSAGNTAISNILSKATVNLIVQTGDQVDRGGYESEWQAYFNGYTLFKDKIAASIPGNHEYYHSDSGNYISPLFYNQFYNNPDNGPTERLNSSYYFHYGNALFVMIDTINREYLSEQQAWFRHVMETNTAQWIIVGTHSGAISAGAYAGDASWTKANWTPLFEEYQVDLAISGHEHIYIRKDLIYKNKIDENLGVTYLVGSSGAAKAYTKQYDDGMTVYQTNYSSNIITLTANNLKCTLYDKDGQETSYSFTLTPKRPATIANVTDNTMRNSIKFAYDKTNDEMVVSWAASLYGNVSSIDIEYVSNNQSKTTNVPIVATKVTSKAIAPIYKDYNYTFNVTLNKVNGSTITKSYDLINRVEYKLSLELNGGTLSNPPTNYFSGATTKLPTPTKEGYRFSGWYLSADFSGEGYTKIDEDVTGDLNYYAKWDKEYVIKFVTNDGTNLKDLKYIENEEINIPNLETTPNAIFKGWYKDDNFSGDKITAIDTTKPEDLTLYAKWSHLCIINLNPDGGKINDDEILYYEGEEFELEEPTKDGYKFIGWYDGDNLVDKITANTTGNLNLTAKYETIRTKKCGKKAEILITFLSSLSLLYFIFKKRN